MRNCLCIILFLVIGLAVPATSVYAYGGEGGDSEAGGGDVMIETESTSSDITTPPSGFTPTTQENADSEITTSDETDPGKEEEVAELVEEVNLLGENAEEGEGGGEDTDAAEGGELDGEGTDSAEGGELDGEGTDSAEGGEVADVGTDSAEGGEVAGEGTDSAEEGEVADGSNDSEGGTTSEDQDDKKTEVATSVDDIDPQGSTQEGATTGQPNPGQGLIGSQGTLPGTRSATLDQITEPEINEDGSVSTWAIYSNDTWVRTTVNPDGTHEVSVVLDSGTVIRPGREYIHTGGSLNPALDAIITALEVTAAAGTVAGWALTVTPGGALLSAGYKSTTAVWGATTGIQALRAGADAYGKELEGGASQGEAILTGTGQAAVNAVVVTQVGKHLEPYQESIGALYDETGKVVTEVALKNYGNVVADQTTKEITGHSPGYLPW